MASSMWIVATLPLFFAEILHKLPIQAIGVTVVDSTSVRVSIQRARITRINTWLPQTIDQAVHVFNYEADMPEIFNRLRPFYLC